MSRASRTAPEHDVARPPAQSASRRRGSTPPAAAGRFGRFLRFAAVAGLGWLFDAALLLGLVAFAGMPAGRANVISSCSAAVSVFLLSRQTVFAKASHHLLARVAGYAGYSLVLIFAASWVVGWLVPLLVPWIAGHLDANPPPPGATSTLATAATLAAAVAKVLVTPPQLLANFFVSRFLAERRIPSKA